jgi:hypothetical protein
MSGDAQLSAGRWIGQLGLVEDLGAALAPLCHTSFAEHSLYASGGLNFEHIFNGTRADEKISWFTPRTDTHRVDAKSDATAFVVHDMADSSWAAESRMTFTLSEDAVDMQFRICFHEQRFPLGWIGLMWASYMARARERRIHFYGERDGVEGWTSLGDDTDDGFETGTVAAVTAPDLPYEEGAALLNVVENPRKRFTYPVYYGLADGDGDLATDDDTMAYTMMFDQTEAIRFAMWNFIQDDSGRPDPHSPAWDWQFVIREPEMHHWYGYRARLEYTPFVDAGDVLDRYHRWAGDGEPSTLAR